MKPLVPVCVALLLAALAPGLASAEDENAVPAASTAPVPAGSYTLDKAHASLIFRLDHLGFSHFTGRFERFDSQLEFDPAHPDRSRVTVTIDPASIRSDNPPEGFMDQLRSAQWLDVAKFPQLVFHSTKVTRTGPKTLRIDGELDLHGVKRPMSLDATYNGGYAGHPMDPHARIGFSARGTLKRSQFGMAFGIPAPGTTMGVSDEVEVIVEAEFSGPPLATAGR
jgi:polyisoprenoid-binding protein YceI